VRLQGAHAIGFLLQNPGVTMSDLSQALQNRTVWLICRDQPAEDDLLLGDSDTAIRPASRTLYEKLRKGIPEPDTSTMQFWVSPARRAQQTASRLIPEVRWQAGEHVGPRLWGAWQGLTWPEVRSRDALRAEAFWSDFGAARPPDGESLHDVMERWNLFATALSNQHDWRTVLVVTHPDVIRAAVCHILDVRLANAGRINVSPLSLTRVSVSFLGWRLDDLNVRAT
jgi:broad specificity phosphatase PhoE